MNLILRNTPLRLLLVEDQHTLRADCRAFLQRRYPAIEIVDVSTVEEALQAIDSNVPFDCAVLDLKLPRKAGDEPLPSTEPGERIASCLGQELYDRMGPRKTWIVQWTAYPEDPAIETFKRSPSTRRVGLIYEVISKRDIDWPKKLLHFIDRMIAERKIAIRLDAPFFARKRQREMAILSRDPRFNRPPVNVPRFVGLLMDVWPLLENYRRKDALDTFAGSEWELEDMGNNTVRLKHQETADRIKEAEVLGELLSEQDSNML